MKQIKVKLISTIIVITLLSNLFGVILSNANNIDNVDYKVEEIETEKENETNEEQNSTGENTQQEEDKNNVSNKTEEVETNITYNKTEDEITKEDSENKNLQVLISPSSNTEKILEENTKVQAKLEEGIYSISTALDNKKVLDISAASMNDKANLQIWQNSNERQQKFKVTYSKENGYYEIINCKSAKSITLESNSKNDGINVYQYTSNTNNTQKWIIEDAQDGYYYIKSAANGLYLDVESAKTKNGTNVQVYTGNGTEAQKFKFTKTTAIMAEHTLEDGYYEIASVLNTKKVLDISAASKDNGANVQIWDNSNVKQQKYKITDIGGGYYTIRNVNSKKVLDVAGAGTVNGTNIQQFDSNNTDAQKWIIYKTDDGYYSLMSCANDKLIDVSNAATKNGTNVQIYESNGTNAQKFKFNKVDVIEGTQSIQDGIYKIGVYNTNNVIDISQASKNNSANVQIWSYENVLQQKFRITYVGDGYYTIKNLNSEKVLDVVGGVGANGTNVWQYDSNGTDAQKWIIRKNSDGYYNIISACNNKFLDVAEGKLTNGTNIQVFEGNGTNAQKFIFEKVTAVELQSGTYGSSGLKIKGDSRGSSLKYYKIGNGPNVFFATFAVHGWEDCFSYDGQELTKIAEAFKDKLISMQDESLASKWTIYIFPSVNPDGEYYGYTHNGPGRTTLYSAAPSNKGIDINRCWSTGYKRYTDDRNYNGTESFQAYEARALRDFLLNHKAQNGQTVLVDLHGWLTETIGDNGIGSYYRSQFGMSKHIYTYGQGYLVNWARSNLGANGRVARSSLVELPYVSNSSQVTNRIYAEKYINATLNMLRGI